MNIIYYNITKYIHKIRSEYLKSSFITSTANIIQAFIGIIRNKILIYLLGPNALGLYGQINQIFFSISNFFGFISSLGAVNLIAEVKEDKNKIKKIMGTFLSLQLILVFLFYISLGFINYNNLFLGINKYNNLLYIVLISIPIYAVIANVSNVYFLGFIKYGKWTKFKIVTNIINISIFVFLIFIFSTKGIFYYFSGISIVIVVYFILIIDRYMGIKYFFSIHFEKEYIKNFISYGGILTSLSLLNMSVLLNLRKIIIAEHGLTENAYFQVGYALSNYYLPLLTNGIWFYIYPKFSEKKLSFIEEKTILIKTIKEILLIGIIISITIIVFSKYIILILYNSSMLNAILVLRLYVIYNIIYVFVYLLQTIFLAKKKLLLYTMFNLLNVLSLFLIFIFFLNHTSKNLIIALLISKFITLIFIVLVYYIKHEKMVQSNIIKFNK